MGRSRSNEDAERQQSRQQLPWGMEKTEMQPSSMTSMTDDKLARFVLGHQKKTKFQKEREDREAKKRQADEEAAKIYATFVASFDNEDESKGKAFVRGGMQAAHQSTLQSGDVYRLKDTEAAVFPGSVSAGKKISEMDKMLREIKQKDVEQMQHKDQLQAKQMPKKRRAIDEFLEEMKERGPAPVTMEGTGMTKGSFDTGDPETTNLYVGNLAPSVTEEALQTEFGRYGEVYSVKIMWPRSEEERARKRNCGFVSFYQRRDADDARINLDNKELEGQPMIVGWGKAVKIQPRVQTPEVLLPTVATPTAISGPISSSYNAEVTGKHAVTIQIPTDEEVKRRVDHLAYYVATDGLQFENAVRIREAENRDYTFLFESRSAVARYYRWKVYSFAMGDAEHSWRETPFQMTLDGPVWLPPKMPPRSRESTRVDRRNGFGQGYVDNDKKLLTGQQIARARDMERGRERSRLSREDYEEFKELLEKLTLERESVKKTMAFALNNSEAAMDLVNIILDSFKSSTSSGVTLIGLLYLTSDILHNSSAAVKNASLFRTTFQEYLPEIMHSLRIAHKNIVGRMSANVMKDKVMNVLTAWESWSLFPPAVLVGLHATFLRKVEEEEYIATHNLNVDSVGGSDIERLRKTCRQSGILASGDAKQLVARLQWLKEFTSPISATTPGQTATMKEPSFNILVAPNVSTIITNSVAINKAKEVNKEVGDGLDGEPIDEDLDCDPIHSESIENESDDVDGEPMDDEVLNGERFNGEDLDGIPMDDEDLDGAPMDEDDLDGEPI
ncbi:U2-associated splicing factor [Phytophthora megakarya]|uniref:U2-associated splicing factor n=1 Tax=Phytophthora megakarya TaxID=4795 RepID=A0A225VBK9_9STRA|nr:U2-associated splicing factor [Phytophthora megakarya]